MPRTIYLDYNATTPLDPSVREVMLPFWRRSGVILPVFITLAAKRARDWMMPGTGQPGFWGPSPVKSFLPAAETESNNLAIFGTARSLKAKGNHLITSAVEHHAVLHCLDYLEKNEGFSVTRLPVDADGRVSPDDLKRALRPDTVLVSIMAANNEIGTIQPVAELGKICRERGIIFHSDAVQWFGKELSNHSINSMRI